MVSLIISELFKSNETKLFLVSSSIIKAESKPVSIHLKIVIFHFHNGIQTFSTLFFILDSVLDKIFQLSFDKSLIKTLLFKKL
jgi:hypothetical protein